MSTERDLKIAVIQEARICLLASSVIKDSSDPANALVVLLSAPLSLFHNQIFNPQAMSEKIREQYGWNLSADALEFFIPKFRSLGWVVSRSGYPSRGPFYVNLPEPETEGLKGVDTRSALGDIGDAFIEFARNVSPLNVMPDDKVEAGAILLKYVVDSSAPTVEPDRASQTEEDYLCARFVGHVTRHKLPIRDTLSSLAAVGFLFRVADEIGRPTKRRRVDLKVVIDGPVLLDYIGTAGETRSEASKELFKGLRKIGASLITFSHCVEEAKDILKMVLKAQPLDRYGPTGEALRKGWVHENFLRSLAPSFDVAVRKEGIEILPDDIEYMPHSHQYFDAERARGIEGIISWHDTQNESALYRDADTVTLTIRRRAFHRTTDLFDSRYVCVTSNDAFAGATRRHLRESNYYNGQQVPPVITISELAARVWLELGNQAEDKLQIPRSQLLMSCDRALRYNRKVVEKAKAELAKVNPTQLKQFELLLEVPRSARAIMDQTLNSEKYVSGSTIEHLVEVAILAAGEHATAKEKEKREKQKKSFEAKLTAAEHDLETAHTTLEERTAQIGKLAEAVRLSDSSMIASLSERASGHFRIFRVVVQLATAIVVVAPLVTAIVAYSKGMTTSAAIALAALVFILGLLAVKDRPGAYLTKKIQSLLNKRLYQQLHSLGRGDLANSIDILWKDGTAEWHYIE